MAGLMLVRGVLSFYRLLSDTNVLERRVFVFLAVCAHLSDLVASARERAFRDSVD